MGVKILKFYIVPHTAGLMDIDYTTLSQGFIVSDTQAYVELLPDTAPRESWQEITEAEFNVAKPVISTPSPPATLEEKVDALGVMMVQIMLK